MNAVSHKHNRRVEVGGGLPGLVFGDNLAAVSEFNRLAARWNEGELRFVFNRVHRDKWHFLKVVGFPPMVAGGFEPVDSELGGDIFRREFGATRTGPATLQQIKRQEPHVRPNLFGIDGGSCRACCTGNPAIAGTCVILRCLSKKRTKTEN